MAAAAHPAPGPAELALRELLDVERSAVVEAVPRSRIGDFRVGPRADLPASTSGAPSVENLTRKADACGAIEAAVGVPPRVYLRSSVELLHDSVLGAIEAEGPTYGTAEGTEDDPVLVTFSDPNANKPLHVGHLRNLFLGTALAGLYRVRGHPVRTEGTISEWGLHVCEALLAYLRHGDGRRPEDVGVKGDHFVGSFYERYHAERTEEDDEEARTLLLRLEAGDPELRRTHDRLIAWAVEGITDTFDRVGTRLDLSHRESDHLDVVRGLLEEGVVSGVLERTDEGAVTFVDVAAETETVLVRSDGTLLVYPQILGIDVVRFAGRDDRIVSLFGHQWEASALTYVRLARALGQEWADRYQLVFYGMVRLPTGSMRSREGHSVTADDAIDRIAEVLRGRRFLDAESVEVGSSQLDAEALAVAGLKYHLLRQHRTKAVEYDMDAVIETSIPRVAVLLPWLGQLPGDVATHARPASGDERAAGAAARDVLMALNGFGRALGSAVERHDPAVLLGYLERLVSVAGRLDASDLDDHRLVDAIGAVVTSGVTALGIVPNESRTYARAR